MIISISGLHGTGKSTLGKKLAEALGLNYYSTGKAFRDLAAEMNMTLEQFTKHVEYHPQIDKELDNKVLEKAKKGDVVIDSQLAGYLLKDMADFKILLTCPLETRVKRMIERDQVSSKEKLKETNSREKSELERFKNLYNIDLRDKKKAKKTYDLIIDTENLSIEGVFNKMLNALKNSFKI